MYREVEQSRVLLRGAKISQVVEWRVILSHINSLTCKGAMSLAILVISQGKRGPKCPSGNIAD